MFLVRLAPQHANQHHPGYPTNVEPLLIDYLLLSCVHSCDQRDCESHKCLAHQGHARSSFNSRQVRTKLEYSFPTDHTCPAASTVLDWGVHHATARILALVRLDR